MCTLTHKSHAINGHQEIKVGFHSYFPGGRVIQHLQRENDLVFYAVRSLHLWTVRHCSHLEDVVAFASTARHLYALIASHDR